MISQTHRQHRAVEFKKFLIAIDKAVPAELEVHLVCDNLATHKTPAIKDWLPAITAPDLRWIVPQAHERDDRIVHAFDNPIGEMPGCVNGTRTTEPGRSPGQ